MYPKKFQEHPPSIKIHQDGLVDSHGVQLTSNNVVVVLFWFVIYRTSISYKYILQGYSEVSF